MKTIGIQTEALLFIAATAIFPSMVHGQELACPEELGMHDAYAVCSYFGTDVVLTRSVSKLQTCEVVSVKPPGGGRFDLQSAVCR